MFRQFKNKKAHIKLSMLTCAFFTFLSLTSDAALSQITSNPDSPDTIRIGLSKNNSSTFDYTDVSISSLAPFNLILEQDGTKLDFLPTDVIKITLDPNGYTVSKDSQILLSAIQSDIKFVPSILPLEITDSKKRGQTARYRGEIVIAKNKPGKFNIVNKLNLDDYLKGVVPNELPVSFGLEALKAQAVAARNYAVKPRVKYNKTFDLCDTVQCQVYFGQNSEHTLSDQAVEETRGLVALYNDEVILALYSSTAGGYTESYENAFSDPASGIFPATPVPYLKAVPDIEGTPLLNTEETARWFYTTNANSFEQASPYFRWTKTWTTQELREVLNRNLPKSSSTKNVVPAFSIGTDVGDIYGIEVADRGEAGKAKSVRITGSNGVWTVQKELVIRRLFENQGKSLPSANFVINTYTDEIGKPNKIEFIGGGYGHGVGMSQYGAGYMGRNGYTFDQILKHYYQGITIGTQPVLLDGAFSHLSKFYCPYGKLSLYLDKVKGPMSLKIAINGQDLLIPIPNSTVGKFRIKLDKFAVKGINEILYYPSNSQEKIKAWVEVVQ